MTAVDELQAALARAGYRPSEADALLVRYADGLGQIEDGRIVLLRSLCYEAESAPLPIRGVIDVRRVREILGPPEPRP